MDWLTEYVLFLAKTTTAVAAVGVLAALAARRLRRRRRPPAGFLPSIEVTHLNLRYREMIAAFERIALPRRAFRERRRIEKAEAKGRVRVADPTNAGANGIGERRRYIFVIDFLGDVRASAADALRDEVTTVLAVAADGDEVVVRLENRGGAPHRHGFAASQLARIRARGIPLTVTVDRIATSGGYMMACVANRILATPFALVGSVGVFASIPNAHRLLSEHGVDVEEHKAGQHKLTVTALGKNTDEGRAKLREQLDNTHRLFKDLVVRYRPHLDIERVSTGEAWNGRDALALHLVDEIRTSDDYLYEASRKAELFRIRARRRPETQAATKPPRANRRGSSVGPTRSLRGCPKRC